MNTSEVGILNVGAGDTKISFDPNNPQDRIRAARVVKDMLRRGYALLVAVGEKDGKTIYRRAEDFDEDTCEYIIADFDPTIGGTNEEQTNTEGTETKPKAKLGRPPKRIAAETTHGVAVHRSAGG